MSYNKTLLAASALLSFTTLTAEASLTLGTAGGKSVVYSSVSDITWTGDANLLGTLGYSTVVSAIIAASPTISDTPNGYDTPANSGLHNVSTSDFSSSNLGRVTWFGAQAFTTYLNSISYAGSNQWALPSAGANPQYGYNPTDGQQFADLYYNELGGTGGSGIIPDTGYFTNEQASQASAYWLAEEASFPGGAFGFYIGFGFEASGTKTNQYFAWAVSPGNVAAVPVPGSVWLFGYGIAGLLGLRRRGNIG